jgi:hypothetical protein
MKMSPSGKVGMMEPSVAMVERDAAVESLIDLHFGSGETVATRLRVDLEAAAVVQRSAARMDTLTVVSLLRFRLRPSPPEFRRLFPRVPPPFQPLSGMLDSVLFSDPVKTIGICRYRRIRRCSEKDRWFSSEQSFSMFGTTRSSLIRTLLPMPGRSDRLLRLR